MTELSAQPRGRAIGSYHMSRRDRHLPSIVDHLDARYVTVDQRRRSHKAVQDVRTSLARLLEECIVEPLTWYAAWLIEIATMHRAHLLLSPINAQPDDLYGLRTHQHRIEPHLAQKAHCGRCEAISTSLVSWKRVLVDDDDVVTRRRQRERRNRPRGAPTNDSYLGVPEDRKRCLHG
jgi:hypothetical protein